MLSDNILLLTDSYKPTQYGLYPPNTEYIFSYLESRGGSIPYTVYFGLQPILKKYLEGQVVTREKIDEAETLFSLHGIPFNKNGWEYILETYDGRLPIEILAVPEGTKVPCSNVLMTVINTDPKCAWLTNYVESILLHVWYPTTVATLSHHLHDLISNYLKRSGASLDSLPYRLHDFGFRGCSSVESASIGGAAHLLSFRGTDNLSALKFVKEFYDDVCAGESIVATEHSNITSWGRDREVDAYRKLLEKNKAGTVACVSDSYNIYEACKFLWGGILKNEVMNRPGTLVVRPDSGVPSVVVPEVLRILSEQFGFTRNSYGYKVLPDQVRVIQGDGVDYDSIQDICETILSHGFSTENVFFGMGGALLQKVDRDTQKFAFKCSAAFVDGEWVEVYKDPIAGGKTSKKGILTLQKNNGKYETVVIDKYDYRVNVENELKSVFCDGRITHTYTFDEVKANLEE